MKINRFKWNKEFLIKHYVDKNMSAQEIADMVGYGPKSSTAIYQQLRKFGIAVRSKKESDFLGSQKILKRNMDNFKGVALGYLAVIRCHARDRGQECTITIDDIVEQFKKQDGLCALSGRKLLFAKRYYAKGDKHTQTASVDRIDSSKGYTKTNIQIVHKDINIMKMDMSQEEFISTCKEIAKYHK